MANKRILNSKEFKIFALLAERREMTGEELVDAMEGMPGLDSVYRRLEGLSGLGLIKRHSARDESGSLVRFYRLTDEGREVFEMDQRLREIMIPERYPEEDETRQHP